MTNKMFLLFLVCMSQPAAATEVIEGQVTAQVGDMSWIVQYDNKRYVCNTTHLCKDFRVDMPFLATFKFTRNKELIDYMTKDRKWHDCVINSCREH